MEPKEQLKIDVGERICKRREELHLSRDSLAEKAEISVPFLCDIENGKKSPSLYVFQKLAESLDMSADRLIFGSGSRSAHEAIDRLLAGMDVNELESIEKTILFIKDNFM